MFYFYLHKVLAPFLSEQHDRQEYAYNAFVAFNRGDLDWVKLKLRSILEAQVFVSV